VSNNNFFLSKSSKTKHFQSHFQKTVTSNFCQVASLFLCLSHTLCEKEVTNQQEFFTQRLVQVCANSEVN